MIPLIVRILLSRSRFPRLRKQVATACSALLGLLLVAGINQAQAASILVVAGTDGHMQAAAANLNTDLSGSNSVTIVDTGVPADISGYTEIYDVRYNNDVQIFSDNEQAQYLAWLGTRGNVLFLLGENPNFNSRNTRILNFITLAGGGSITTPVVNTASENVAPAFGTTPNVISTITWAAAGLVTSCGTGAFATTEANGTEGASLYFAQGTLANAMQGALVVVFDVNFLSDDPPGTTNAIAFRHNLENFVATGGVVTPAGYVLSFATDGTAGATLTGSTSQTITSGGNATAVTANAPTGYAFLDWTGTSGFSSTTANPLTVTNVTADHAITANFTKDAVLITVPPASTLVVPSGGSATNSFTLAAQGSVTQPVTLTATGLPAGATCTFSNPSVDVSGGPVTVTATATGAAPVSTTFQLTVQ